MSSPANASQSPTPTEHSVAPRRAPDDGEDRTEIIMPKRRRPDGRK
jgi:hypothetical protein